MHSLPTIRPINRPLLRFVSQCSQFIRLDGRLGWLKMPANPCQDGYEFRTAFETRILPYCEGMFDEAEATTSEDLAAFYCERAGISADLSAYYATSTYTGD